MRPSDAPHITSSIQNAKLGGVNDALEETKERFVAPRIPPIYFNMPKTAVTLVTIYSVIDCILYAGYDASGIIMGFEDMEDMSDDTLAKYLGIPLEHLKIVVPFVFAIYSFTLNFPALVSGLQNSYADFNAWFKGEPLEFLPNSYCERIICCLSPQTKIRMVIGSILFIGAFAAAADGIGGDYFIMNAKEDISYLKNSSFFYTKIFSIYCSYVVAKMTFFTETPEVKKFFFKSLFPDLSLPNKLPPRLKILARYLGDFLRVIGGVEVAIEIYVALVALMTAHATGFRWILFILSFIRSTSDLFFTGQKGLDAIDALFLKLYESDLSLREIIAFVLTLLPIALVVDAQRELFRAFLTEPDTALPFNCPPSVIEIIADGTAVREGIVQAYTIYPLVIWLLNFIIASSQNALNCCIARCHSDANMEDEYDENAEEKVELLSPEDRNATKITTTEEVEYVPPQLNFTSIHTDNNPYTLFNSSPPNNFTSPLVGEVDPEGRVRGKPSGPQNPKQ